MADSSYFNQETNLSYRSLENDTSSDQTQGSSAPTRTVYVNTPNERSGGRTFAESPPPPPPPTTTTSNIPLIPPYADYLTASMRPRKHSSHHHHRANRFRAQSRYPYVPYFNRPSAFRRDHTPNAPSMSEHLSSSYRDQMTISSRSEMSGSFQDSRREEEEDPRPRKSLWILSRLLFFVLAIEFTDALETALTVPILTSLHVDESYLSMVWLVSPILAFFLQPIFGLWSDTCKCRWGRRRPFILALAIGAYIGVTFLFNGPDLGAILGDQPASDTYVPIRGVMFIAIGVTLVDFCADGAHSPIRAYLIDTTNIMDQEHGFTLHAILGLGGCLGYAVGTVEWPSVPMFKTDGGSYSIIFYIASVVFVVCTLLTLTSVREDPLKKSSSGSSDERDSSSDEDESTEIEMNETRPLLPTRRNRFQSSTSSKKSTTRSTANRVFNDLNRREGFVEIDPATGGRIPHDLLVDQPDGEIALQTFQTDESAPVEEFTSELQQKAKLIKLGIMRRPALKDKDDSDNKNVTIKSMLISMVRMPSKLWKLVICQIIGWVGYFSTHLFFTDFMAEEVYNGTIEHGHDDPAYLQYKTGITMGCWGLFVFAASSAIYAFCLERWLSRRFPLKLLYFVGYFIYVVGCLINFFFHHVAVNIAMCFTFGILIVSINVLPFQMLAQFHSDETYRNRDGSRRGIGIDCALLNSCRFLGELIVAASLGPLIKETSVNYSMIVAAGFTFFGNITMFFLFYFEK